MTGINIRKLKGKMVELGVSMEQLAEALKINTSTLYRKFNSDGKTMLICDAIAIAEFLQLSAEEAIAIFFPNYVA